jgi:Holliday junction resolvasome RuvABC endonuclease subunit
VTVLALDLGSRMGWALLRADGRVESGVEAFSPKTNESPGGRFNRFRRWLVDMKQAHPELARIAYENVNFIGGPQGTYAVQVYGGFEAIVLMFCDHHQIECRGHAVGTVKKRFAGSGKATKDDMIAQCRAMGFKPQDDNEADAIAVLHVATDRCPVLTMNGATPKKRRTKSPPTIPAGADPF